MKNRNDDKAIDAIKSSRNFVYSIPGRIASGIRSAFNLSMTIKRLQFDLDHPGQLCDLNMPLADTPIWQTRQGALMTVIRISGSKQFVGHQVHNEHVTHISNTLKAFTTNGTTNFCWVHDHQDEYEQSVENIIQALSPVRFVSSTQGYENKIFIDEVVNVHAPVIQSEKTFLAIWTLPGEGFGKPLHVPTIKARGVQNSANLKTATRIINSHTAKYHAINEAIQHAGFHTQVLTNTEMAKEMAIMLDPVRNQYFTPRLFPGIDVKKIASSDRNKTDKPKLTIRAPADPTSGHKAIDYTTVMPPTIGRQIWNTTPEYRDSYFIVGSRAYATIIMTLTPERPVPFESFVKSLKMNSVPFRMTQYSKSAGKTMLQAKKTLAAMFRGTSNDNETLFKSTNEMIGHINRNNASVSIQIAVCTWSKKDEIDLLNQRVEYIIKAINAWGGSQATLLRDDAVFGVATTLGFYMNKSVAPSPVGPIEEVVFLAPLTRPALPWSEGAIILTSTTGKMMPFQPLSKDLGHHVYLICGEPGFGKSLFSQIINIAIAESHELLPYIAISDVGPGSLGTVRYLQCILPKNRKHQAVYLEMRNTKSMSINRFDTLLGLRRPLSDDYNQIINWVLIGVSDGEKDSHYSSISDCVNDCISFTYDRFSDSGPRAEPRRFEPSDQEDKYWKSIVAPALDELNIVPDRNTLYWDLVDALFDAGHYRAATLIQRFAVPLLADVIESCSTSFIRESHGEELSKGYTIADHVHKKLTSMRKMLEVSKLPTQIDIADSRVTAFNLEAVVKKSDSPAIIRQGALFYGLTASLQVDRFFWDEARVQEVPLKYRHYHQAHFDLVSKTRNLYFADEQHYFTGVKEAVSIPENIAFLGRKRGVGVMLSTQTTQFFTDTMKELSTIRFFMGFSRNSIPRVVDDMKLNKWEEWFLSKEITKPGKNGSKFLIQVDAASGNYSQAVILRVGARKLWSLSTQQQSSILRERVIKEFPYEVAIEILSRLYPSGEIESEYERLRQQSLDVHDTDSGLLNLEKTLEIRDILEHMIQKTIEQGKQLLPEIHRAREMLAEEYEEEQ